MSDYVIDASLAVEYLLQTPVGLRMSDTLDSSSLVAPDLIDAEVLSALRREVLGRRVEESHARMVIEALLVWPFERISHRLLAPLAWEHYQNVSAYDAFYVAAARIRDIPLLTADGRLSRASGLGIAVQYVHMG